MARYRLTFAVAEVVALVDEDDAVAAELRQFALDAAVIERTLARQAVLVAT